MSRIRGSIDIPRSVEDVFAVVADQRNEVSYNSQMTGCVKTGDGPIGVGTQFEATMSGHGKPFDLTVEYTAYDPPRHLASRSVMGGTVVVGDIRLEPTAAGTHFSWDWDVQLPWPARLAAPLVGLIGRRQEQRIWAGLAAYMTNGRVPS